MISRDSFGYRSKPYTPGEYQNSWDLWMFISIKILLFIGFYRYWSIAICHPWDSLVPFRARLQGLDRISGVQVAVGLSSQISPGRPRCRSFRCHRGHRGPNNAFPGQTLELAITHCVEDHGHVLQHLLMLFHHLEDFGRAAKPASAWEIDV